MRRIILVSLATLVLQIVFVSQIFAAGPSASGSFNKKTNSVNANFTGLKGVKSVSYMLYYTGNGIPQGVVGSIKPGKAKSASRKLYLGTCSGRVCVAHRNVKNLKLSVKFNSGGKTTTKTVKIK